MAPTVGGLVQDGQGLRRRAGASGGDAPAAGELDQTRPGPFLWVGDQQGSAGQRQGNRGRGQAFGRGQRQGNADLEGGADAALAVNGDLATDGVGETVRDHQAEPAAAIESDHVPVGLRVGLEQAAQRLLGDAGPGILDRDPQAHATFGGRFRPDLDGDPALLGELESVAGEVDQHLPQAARVGAQDGGRGRVDVDDQLQPAARGGGIEQCLQPVEEGREPRNPRRDETPCLPSTLPDRGMRSIVRDGSTQCQTTRRDRWRRRLGGGVSP